MTSLQLFTESVDFMVFYARNIVLTGLEGTSAYFCSNWTLAVEINVASFSLASTLFDGEINECNDQEENRHLLIVSHSSANLLLGNTLLCIVLSLSSFALYWSYLMKSIDYFVIGRANLEIHEKLKEESKKSQGALKPVKDEHSRNWSEFNRHSRQQLMDIWVILQMLANILQFLYSVDILIMLYFNNPYDLNCLSLMMGMSSFLSWFCILRYFSVYSNFFNVTSAFKAAQRDFSIFFVGIIPLFMAFVGIGLTLFYFMPKFQDMKQTVISLISLMFGDIVNETYLEIQFEGSYLGIIYITLLMVTFFTSLQNVFVMIIMEGRDRVSREEVEFKRSERRRKKLIAKFEDSDTEEEKLMNEAVAKEIQKGTFGFKEDKKASDSFKEPSIVMDWNEEPAETKTKALLGGVREQKNEEREENDDEKQEDYGYKNHVVDISHGLKRKYSFGGGNQEPVGPKENIEENTKEKEKDSTIKESQDESSKDLNPTNPSLVTFDSGSQISIKWLSYVVLFFEIVLGKLQEKTCKLAVRIGMLENKVYQTLLDQNTSISHFQNHSQSVSFKENRGK